MKFLNILSALCIIFSCQGINAKLFDRCTLARELSRLGVPRSELPDWVCIAQYESTFNTGKTNTNKNKSKDWGLFQINDRWWCDPQDGRKTKNGCKLTCNQLLSDDITNAVRCAQQVKREQGYTAWVAWNKYCQGSKPNVSDCF